MPPVKEVDYFVEELNWPRGQDWYEEQFARVPEASLTGDISPNYSKHPHFGGVPKRMAGVVPEAKLIYLLRDPVARMRSHWVHAVDSGTERDPLGATLLGSPYFRECSSYGMQLERYLEHFPRERVLLLTAEELRADRHATLKRVFEFLGVAADLPVAAAPRAQHPSEDKRVPRRGVPKALGRGPLRGLARRRLRPAETSLSEAEEQRLRELMRPDMERLARYMPAGFDAWGILR